MNGRGIWENMQSADEALGLQGSALAALAAFLAQPVQCTASRIVKPYSEPPAFVICRDVWQLTNKHHHLTSATATDTVIGMTCVNSAFIRAGDIACLEVGCLKIMQAHRTSGSLEFSTLHLCLFAIATVGPPPSSGEVSAEGNPGDEEEQFQARERAVHACRARFRS